MKILVAGDYCPIERVSLSIIDKEYESIFSSIREYIQNADLSIVNLECPVCIGDYMPINKQGPNLQIKTKNAVAALKYAGFDMVTLANNHIYDYGKEGLYDTIRACRESGLDVVGAGANIKDAERVFYKSVGSKILGIVNCCEHEFSIATEERAGANPINPIRQYYAIQEAKKNLDYVIVIVHGGHEYFQLPSLRMKETYRFFVDSGADVVINHHQHCFSGAEIYKNKPIYYGLGNFCFDRVSKYKEEYSIWNEGYMVEIEFVSNDIKSREIPYIQCFRKPTIEIVKDTYSFNAKFKQLSAIIADDRKLKTEVDKYYEQSSQYIGFLFEPYTNRYMTKLRKMNIIPSFVNKQKVTALLNFIDCEAHRDKILYFLYKQSKD